MLGEKSLVIPAVFIKFAAVGTGISASWVYIQIGESDECDEPAIADKARHTEELKGRYISLEIMDRHQKKSVFGR